MERYVDFPGRSQTTPTTKRLYRPLRHRTTRLRRPPPPFPPQQTRRAARLLPLASRKNPQAGGIARGWYPHAVDRARPGTRAISWSCAGGVRDKSSPAVIGKKTPASLVSPISGSLRPGRTGRLLASLSVLKRRPSGWIPGTAYARSPKTRARFGDPPFRSPFRQSVSHSLYGLRSGSSRAGTTPDSRPLPTTPLQGSLGENCVRKIPLAPLY